MSAFVEILTDVVVGDLNKDGPKKGLKVFINARVAEGVDQEAARAEAMSVLKEIQKGRNELPP